MQDVISAYLRAKAASPSGQQSVSSVKSELCRELDVRRICLLDDRDNEIHGCTQLRNALPQVASVVITFHFQTGPSPSDSGSDQTSEAAESSPIRTDGFGAGLCSDPGEAPSHPVQAEQADDPAFSRFVVEFDRRERRSGAMWAKHVVNDLLPELGFSLPEGKAFLRELQLNGVLTTSKMPSRDNPEFPATQFHLNREHPLVKQVLERERGTSRASGRSPGMSATGRPQNDSRTTSRPLIKLPPGTELLSEQIVRERR